MTICCPPQAIIIEKSKPVSAIVVEKAKPVAVVTAIKRGPAGAPGTPGTGSEIINTFSPTAGQTMFTLSNVVSQPHLSKVFLNGQKLCYGVNYTFSGSMSILVYIPTDYNLDSLDTLEIFYYYL